MAVVEDRVDLTGRLPDELLHKIFTYLPLRNKLRIESVSHRFQRCVLTLLELQPQPLELNTETKHLNGYSIQSWQVNDALWSLAKRAKFSAIKIHIGWKTRNAEQTAEMDSVLSLLSQSDSLDKVVSFECNYGPSQHMLGRVIAQCSKLATITFDFLIHHPEEEREESLWHEDVLLMTPTSVALDLSSVLSSNALTQLDLRLAAYDSLEFFKLFLTLKPHTLQKLSLTLSEMVDLNWAETVTELSAGAWSSLQEINICWKCNYSNWHTTYLSIDLADFIKSLIHIPAMNKCHVEFGNCTKPSKQFVEAVTALFSSNIKITLKAGNGCLLRHNEDECQVVAQIRQVQVVHPNVGIDFYGRCLEYGGSRRGFLTLVLSMGNGTFEEEHDLSDGPNPCADPGCLECHRFYPHLVQHLGVTCYQINQDTHLEHQLTTCGIDSLVEHLNYAVILPERVRFLSAEVNGDLVTLVVETRGTNDQNLNQYILYSITIDCVPCFSTSCIRCVNVE